MGGVANQGGVPPPSNHLMSGVPNQGGVPPPNNRSMMLKTGPSFWGYGADGCCGSSDESAMLDMLVGIVAAQLVAKRIGDEAVRRAMLAELDDAQQQMLRVFLSEIPRSKWLGTESSVLRLISQLGMTAATYPDPDMRDALYAVGVQIAEFVAKPSR